MIKKIVTVKAEIRKAVLLEYLKCCSKVHKIAFLQWRLLFPNSVKHNKEMLEELITGRLRMLKNDYDYHLENTIGGAKLPNKEWALNHKFYKKYGEVITDARDHNVLSFK